MNYMYNYIYLYFFVFNEMMIKKMKNIHYNYNNKIILYYYMSIRVFTDGSYIKVGDKCGYGIHFPNHEFDDISRRFKLLPKTNQRAELYSIYKAIKIINKRDETIKIIIHTDSEYSINTYTKWIEKWKKDNWIGSNKQQIKNQDIIKKTSELIEKHKGTIEFIHVKSHTNNTDYKSIHNSIADELARNGAEKDK